MNETFRNFQDLNFPFIACAMVFCLFTLRKWLKNHAKGQIQKIQIEGTAEEIVEESKLYHPPPPQCFWNIEGSGN